MSKHSLMFTMSLTLLGSLAPALTGEAHAEDPEPLTVEQRIPASACQPATVADRDMLNLVNGSWAFADGETGTATVVCPVVHPHSYIYIWFDVLRLWYRDPDGKLTGSQVTAQLFGRDKDSGNVSAMPSMSSNTSAATSNSTIFAGNGVYYWSEQTMFFIKVTVKRTSATASVAFHGIETDISNG